jgi:hypothetical protein
MKYTTKFDISQVTLGSVEEVAELFRSYATVTIDYSHKEIVCIFDVGKNGAADDLWDLRDVFTELETQLVGYVDYGEETLPKPEPWEAI